MTSPEKIEKLLFVLFIAFVWSYKLGVTKQEENPIPSKASWKAEEKSILPWIGLFTEDIKFYRGRNS